MSVTDALTHHEKGAKPERPEDVRASQAKKKNKRKNWEAQLSANRSSDIAAPTTVCSMCLNYGELVMRTDQTAEEMIGSDGDLMP